VAGGGFPWGTLAVNLVGCFLIGLSFGWAERFAWWTPTIRLFFVTGFLGALTTFSSFAAETMNADSVYIAGTNILVNNVGGLVLVLVGMGVARAT
jgi:CrcB protein